MKLDKEIQDQLYDPIPKRCEPGICAALEKKGIDCDVVDVPALIDSTLSCDENKKNILKQVGARKTEKHRKYAQMAKQFYAGTGKLAHASPDERAAAFADMREKGTLRGYDPSQTRPPKNWFRAMYEGIRKRSDVRNPASIVVSIWRRISPSKRAEIKRKEQKGGSFKYDLPLPEDHATRGSGTVRIVKPFRLAEVQVNVPMAAYDRILGSGLFQRMKRNDGSTALVKRCKSNSGNCNIFIDRS